MDLIGKDQLNAAKRLGQTVAVPFHTGLVIAARPAEVQALKRASTHPAGSGGEGRCKASIAAQACWFDQIKLAHGCASGRKPTRPCPRS